MIVRDPLQSLESWLEKDWFAADAYFEIVYKITNMLGLLDHPRFQLFPSAAVRLEDIQAAPEVTMSALARWMGVPFEESLLRTTMHGLRWWNEPSSALFEQDDPFGANSPGNPLKRQVGTLLNSEDQSRLAPLYAPFCRTFGYEDRLPKRLDAAVQDALDRLNEPFHFETRFAVEKGIDLAQLCQSGSYRYLRAVMAARLNCQQEGKADSSLIRPIHEAVAEALVDNR